jgi:hypothetical protein
MPLYLQRGVAMKLTVLYTVLFRTLLNLICVWPCIIIVGKVNMKHQLDATITLFIDLQDQLNMFRANLFPSSGAHELVFFTTYDIMSCYVVGRGFRACCLSLRVRLFKPVIRRVYARVYWNGTYLLSRVWVLFLHCESPEGTSYQNSVLLQDPCRWVRKSQFPRIGAVYICLVYVDLLSRLVSGTQRHKMYVTYFGIYSTLPTAHLKTRHAHSD